MTDNPGAATTGGPAPDGLTDAEKLAALETYIKALKPIADRLRARVTIDMGNLKVERVGAYLGDMRLAAVSRSEGRLSARVADEEAALIWCIEKHPEEVQTIQVIRPAFLKLLTDVAKADGAKPGDKGVDPKTGEELPFIEVVQGAPYVSITTTDEGVSRMGALANGFAGILEAGA